MKYIQFNGHQLAYTKKGSGLPLIFLHGFGEDSGIWDEFVEKFSDDYSILRIDLPGFGGSDPVENPTISYMAEAVVAVVEKLKMSQCILIGHSMGGYVGLAFAQMVLRKYGKDQQLLTGLGLFHSHPFSDSEEKKDARQKGIDFIHRHGHALYVKQLIMGLFAPGFARDNQVLVERLTYTANRYSSAGIIGGLQAMKNRPDRSEVLRTINCPVLFIIGREDKAIPEQASLDQTHLPAVASIHILPKVGHMGMFEARKKCTKILKDFIAFCQL